MTVKEFLNEKGIVTIEDYRNSQFANDELIDEEMIKAGGQKTWQYKLSNHPNHYACHWYMHTTQGLVPCFNIITRAPYEMDVEQLNKKVAEIGMDHIHYIAEKKNNGREWECYYPVDDQNYGIEKTGGFKEDIASYFNGFLIEDSAIDGMVNIILLY
jgi:hypothetical protein